MNVHMHNVRNLLSNSPPLFFITYHFLVTYISTSGNIPSFPLSDFEIMAEQASIIFRRSVMARVQKPK